MLPSPDDVVGFRRAVEAGIPEPLKPSDAIERLFVDLERAERHLRELEKKRLVAAFLGGTGVGKSTLLNAIAGAPISRAGDRRPTTDRVVCYRHKDDPLPDWLPPEDLAAPPPAPHEVDSLRGVLLLDLPDIDSRVLGHRRITHRLLPRLDVLVVVTSADKYGDRVLYDELAALPQAPRNLTFVLNAVDLLQPEEIPVVKADFLDKLAGHAAAEKPTVFTMSALRAYEGKGDGTQGDFAEFVKYLDVLGEDSTRKAVLAANAESSLGRVEKSWQTALPEEEVEGWFQALRRVPVELPAPDTALQAGLQDHLAEVIGPWISDRALRSSWFPIGPLHFLIRRFRGRRAKVRAANPVLSGRDPCAGFSERVMATPLRLAAHQAEAALRPQSDKLTLELPEVSALDTGQLRLRVAPWWDELALRVPRLAWRLRQHVLPVLFALLWAGWVAAQGLRAQTEGAGVWRSLGKALLAAVTSLSPTVLATAGGALLLYYLLVYPYYLYRLERAILREAKRGAGVYLTGWRDAYAETWGNPYRDRIDAAARWWDDAKGRFDRLRAKGEGAAAISANSVGNHSG